MAFGLKIPLHGRAHHPTGADPINGMIFYDFANVGDWLNVETGVTGDAPSTEFTGQASMLLQVVGDGGWLPIVLRVSQDSGTNFSEYAFGYEQVDWYDTTFSGWDVDSNQAWMFDSANFNYIFNLRDSQAFSVFGAYGSKIIKATTDKGVDICSPPDAIDGFPFNFENASVQIAAGDDSNHGTICIEAFDGQSPGIPAMQYTGHVEFTPGPFIYDGHVFQLFGGTQTFTIVDTDGSAMLQMTTGSPDVHIKSGGSVIADL